MSSDFNQNGQNGKLELSRYGLKLTKAMGQTLLESTNQSSLLFESHGNSSERQKCINILLPRAGQYKLFRRCDCRESMDLINTEASLHTLQVPLSLSGYLL